MPEQVAGIQDRGDAGNGPMDLAYVAGSRALHKAQKLLAMSSSSHSFCSGESLDEQWTWLGLLQATSSRTIAGRGKG